MSQRYKSVQFIFNNIFQIYAEIKNSVIEKTILTRVRKGHYFLNNSLKLGKSEMLQTRVLCPLIYAQKGRTLKK